MNEFKISFLMGLRNHEFPKLYTQLCSVLEAETIEDVNVKESLEGAISHLEELKFVMNMRNPHPLTEVLEDQVMRRKTYLVSLRGRVFASLKSPIAKDRKSGKVLSAWINKHCKRVYIASIMGHSRMVDNMLQDYTINLETQEALADLGLNDVWDAIVAISQEVDSNFIDRSKQLAADVRKANAIRQAAYKDLKKFLKAVEVSLSLEKPGEHFFLDCSREINSLLEFYRVNYLSRTTRRKNAAQKAEENQPEDHENDNQGGETTPDSQPERAGSSRTFNVMTLDGMDSHSDLNGESLNGNGVMSNGVTNGKAIDGKKEEPSTGNGHFGNEEAVKPENAIVLYDGTSNGSDQKS